MPLSCYCDFDDPERIYYPPRDYQRYSWSEGLRRRRCSSCKTTIQFGDICAKFERTRYPQSEIEGMIYGDDAELPLAPHFLCETCADLWFSLYELGFECVSPDENIHHVVAEYASMQWKNYD